MDTRREIVFIDTALTDWKTLLASFSNEVEVVLLDPRQNGVQQIAAYLAPQTQQNADTPIALAQDGQQAAALPVSHSYTLYDAIHILSHGSAGHLYLGATDLNSNNLTDYQSQLQQIGAALIDTGDLLLYGCNVAEGDVGNQFITALAAVTGADVAASNDLTGAAALGGDWELEANTGAIDTATIDASSYSNTVNLSYSDLPTENLGIIYGSFLARAIYGGSAIPAAFQGSVDNGYADDYAGYLTALSGTWNVLAREELGNYLASYSFDSSPGEFTDGGLFIASPGDVPDGNKAEALVAETMVNGQKTIFLTFRGSDGADAFYEGQTWTASGQRSYYESLQPLIDSIYQYAIYNEVDQLVVSGHSLGGSIADIFTLRDAWAFRSLLNIDVQVVSIASAGVQPDLYKAWGGVSLEPDYINLNADGNIISINTPDFYVGIAHSEDRVRYPADEDGTFLDGLTPNDSLLGNIHFKNDFVFDLKNISNLDVDYGLSNIFTKGFGAEHNGELYWANIYGFFTDELNAYYTNQNVILGISDYSQTPDWNGLPLDLFGKYSGTSIYGVDNETLNGSSGNDYILGLTGNDNIIGWYGNDLLSGGKGEDTLQGLTGRDILYGGKGNDILIGGGGKLINAGSEGDTLIGGVGADIFKYVLEDVPPLGTSAPTYLPHAFDEIVDYNQGNSGSFDSNEGDILDVSAVVGSVYANGNGEPIESLIRIKQLPFNNDTALLEVDLDGRVNGENWVPLAVFNGLHPGMPVAFKLNSASLGADAEIPVRGQPGSWTITPISQMVDEDTGTISFLLKRPTSDQAETVYISTTINQSHANNNDYTYWLNEAITLPAHETEYTVDIHINNDNHDEVIETFGLVVQSSPYQDIDDHPLAQATFSIIDDDLPGSSATFTPNNDLVWIEPPRWHGIFQRPGGHRYRHTQSHRMVSRNQLVDQRQYPYLHARFGQSAF